MFGYDPVLSWNKRLLNTVVTTQSSGATKNATDPIAAKFLTSDN
jgi:hypothetical protein